MPPDEFRAIGHSLVDAVADFLARLPDAPTASPLLPNAMRGMLGKRKPAFVQKHDGHGHAFAAWRWD